MDWEGLDTDIWKNFIAVVFSKLVYSVEGENNLFANEICEEEAVLSTILTNCVSSSLC